MCVYIGVCVYICIYINTDSVALKNSNRKLSGYEEFDGLHLGEK